MKIIQPQGRIPVNIYRAEETLCCKATALLVKVSDGGFVQWLCTDCKQPFHVSDTELQNIRHSEHCPKCEGNMTLSPNLLYANYGYVCRVCHIEVQLGDLIPPSDTV